MERPEEVSEQYCPLRLRGNSANSWVKKSDEKGQVEVES